MTEGLTEAESGWLRLPRNAAYIMVRCVLDDGAEEMAICVVARTAFEHNGKVVE